MGRGRDILLSLGKFFLLKGIGEIAGFYKERFGYPGTFEINGPTAEELRLSIVIPCYDEDPSGVLESLGTNKAAAGQVEVLLVFNHSNKTGEEVRLLHQEQVGYWQGKRLPNGVPVYTVPAFDLPQKHAGVGLARKIGMDIALQRFSDVGHNGIIVCLDADCTVTSNYLSSLLAAERSKASGLSIAFEHPLEGIKNDDDRNRIVHYENWLRYYIQALRFAGYPHAFHTIGSSMAVRASAYAKIGGMNRRKAGEDFYFLHKLIPQGSFYDLNRCRVFPSARVSERVPFGTGRAMLEMEEGKKDFTQVYHPQIFREVKSFLTLDAAIFESGHWPEPILRFGKNAGWPEQLAAIKARSRNKDQLMVNFYHWFDGFKMLKLVHHLRDEQFGLIDVRRASGELLNFTGNDHYKLLQHLRRLDFNSPKSLHLSL